MKKLSILLFSVLTVACVTGYNPTYYFNEIQVVNLTGSTISQVSLRVGVSGRTLNCNEVLYHAMCHERFGSRRYPQEVVELGWIHRDGDKKSQQLTPRIPAYYFPTFPLRIVLEIREDGSVKALFEQDEPDGPIFF